MSGGTSRHRLPARVLLWWSLISVAFLTSGVIVFFQVRNSGVVLAGVGLGLLAVMLLVDLTPGKASPTVRTDEPPTTATSQPKDQ